MGADPPRRHHGGWRLATKRPASPPAQTAADKPQFAYIDCLRGYAVLLVMVSHTVYAFPDLPYPIHKIGVFGWNGVQLFFLASSLTLLMSYHQERARTGGFNARNFFIRRFLRIAPMYYLAAGFYTLLSPPAAPSVLQLLATLSFLNAWRPVPTGAWTVVPGGWSIGVEFTFYLLFPLFAAVATSVRRLAAIFAAAVAVGAVLDSWLLPTLARAYDARAADIFLFDWFPDQAPVFVLGGLCFLAIRALGEHPTSRIAVLVRRRSGTIVAASLGLGLLIALSPAWFSHQLLAAPAVPEHIAAALVFTPFIIGLSQAHRSPLVNRAVASLGKVSFSAYLLHFAVIKLLPESHPALFLTQAHGWRAIAAFAACYPVVAVVTYLASSITYAVIEQPGMRQAKRLTQATKTTHDKAPRLAA